MEYPEHPCKGGQRVRYLGCSDAQVTYGGHDDPRPLLVIGQEYIVETAKIYAWKTDIKLSGIIGRFNSVCFEVIAD
jgi:hypothetical protein